MKKMNKKQFPKVKKVTITREYLRERAKEGIKEQKEKLIELSFMAKKIKEDQEECMHLIEQYERDLI